MLPAGSLRLKDSIAFEAGTRAATGAHTSFVHHMLADW